MLGLDRTMNIIVTVAISLRIVDVCPIMFAGDTEF